MKKNLKISIIIGLLILENIGLWYIADFYLQAKSHERILVARKGQVAICSQIAVSTDLLSVLTKMKQFTPAVSIAWFSPDSINLSYGSESADLSGGPGVTFIFGKDMKLTNKSCDSKWEPGVPGLPNFRE